MKAFNALKKKDIDLTGDFKMVEAIFKFAVMAYKKEPSLKSACMEMICSHAPMLGLPCLHYIINKVVSVCDDVTAFSSEDVAQV